MPKKTTDEKIDDLALAVAHGLEELREQVRAGFAAVSSRFDGVEQRLDRVEFFASGQDRRISIVEDRLRQLATKVGLDFGRP